LTKRSLENAVNAKFCHKSLAPILTGQHHITHLVKGAARWASPYGGIVICGRGYPC
jgi:hypothetical protein